MVPPSTPSSRRATRVVRYAVLAASIACGTERPLAPSLVTDPAISAVQPLAFTASVDMRARSVRVVAPTAGSLRASVGGRDDGAVALSLLGGDAVRILASDVRITPAAPGTTRLRVRFDIVVESRLPGIRLVAPTWPTPPVARIVLFPLRVRAPGSAGTVTGGDGNVVTVTQPGFGQVFASDDFDGDGSPGSGAPWNFLTDAPCRDDVLTTCFRWKAVSTEIAPLGRSPRATIGFEMDATVQAFSAQLIVAADLAPAGTPTAAQWRRASGL